MLNRPSITKMRKIGNGESREKYLSVSELQSLQSRKEGSKITKVFAKNTETSEELSFTAPVLPTAQGMELLAILQVPTMRWDGRVKDFQEPTARTKLTK